jgi:hypothetical protein
MKLSRPVAIATLLLVGATPVYAQTGDAATDPAAATNAVTETGAPTAADRLQAGVATSVLLSTPPQGLTPAPAWQPETAADAPAAMVMQTDRRGGVTWIVVGGALLGAGLLVGGDAGTALSVGGALIGVYGVYLLVRSG